MAFLSQKIQTNFISQPETSSEDFDSKYYTQFHHKIGLTQFHTTPVVNNKSLKCLNHTIVNKLSSQTLDITDFYLYWRWEYLFKSIKKMGHLKVDIYENYYKNVLRDVAGVEWFRLRKVKLNLTNTSCVEAISWLNCENLQEIEMVVRVRKIKKPFAKSMFRKLRTIKIECDGMDEVDLGRMNFTDDEPLNINLYGRYISKSSEKQFMQDLSYLSKVGYRGQVALQHQGQKKNYKGTQFKNIQILSSMLTRICNRYKIDISEQDNEPKHQGMKIIECLLERKFQIILDQEQQQRQEYLNALLGGVGQVNQ